MTIKNSILLLSLMLGSCLMMAPADAQPPAKTEQVKKAQLKLAALKKAIKCAWSGKGCTRQERAKIIAEGVGLFAVIAVIGGMGYWRWGRGQRAVLSGPTGLQLSEEVGVAPGNGKKEAERSMRGDKGKRRSRRRVPKRPLRLSPLRRAPEPSLPTVSDFYSPKIVGFDAATTQEAKKVIGRKILQKFAVIYSNMRNNVQQELLTEIGRTIHDAETHLGQNHYEEFKQLTAYAVDLLQEAIKKMESQLQTKN